jgi:hypothetical protein
MSTTYFTSTFFLEAKTFNTPPPRPRTPIAAIVIRSFGAAQALGRLFERVTAAAAAPTDFERKTLRFIMSS